MESFTNKSTSLLLSKSYGFNAACPHKVIHGLNRGATRVKTKQKKEPYSAEEDKGNMFALHGSENDTTDISWEGSAACHERAAGSDSSCEVPFELLFHKESVAVNTVMPLPRSKVLLQEWDQAGDNRRNTLLSLIVSDFNERVPMQGKSNKSRGDISQSFSNFSSGPLPRSQLQAEFAVSPHKGTRFSCYRGRYCRECDMQDCWGPGGEVGKDALSMWKFLLVRVLSWLKMVYALQQDFTPSLELFSLCLQVPSVSLRDGDVYFLHKKWESASPLDIDAPRSIRDALAAEKQTFFAIFVEAGGVQLLVDMLGTVCARAPSHAREENNSFHVHALTDSGKRKLQKSRNNPLWRAAHREAVTYASIVSVLFLLLHISKAGRSYREMICAGYNIPLLVLACQQAGIRGRMALAETWWIQFSKDMKTLKLIGKKHFAEMEPPFNALNLFSALFYELSYGNPRATHLVHGGLLILLARAGQEAEPLKDRRCGSKSTIGGEAFQQKINETFTYSVPEVCQCGISAIKKLLETESYSSISRQQLPRTIKGSTLSRASQLISDKSTNESAKSDVSILLQDQFLKPSVHSELQVDIVRGNTSLGPVYGGGKQSALEDVQIQSRYLRDILETYTSQSLSKIVFRLLDPFLFTSKRACSPYSTSLQTQADVYSGTGNCGDRDPLIDVLRVEIVELLETVASSVEEAEEIVVQCVEALSVEPDARKQSKINIRFDGLCPKEETTGDNMSLGVKKNEEDGSRVQSAASEPKDGVMDDNENVIVFVENHNGELNGSVRQLSNGAQQPKIANFEGEHGDAVAVWEKVCAVMRVYHTLCGKLLCNVVLQSEELSENLLERSARLVRFCYIIEECFFHKNDILEEQKGNKFTEKRTEGQERDNNNFAFAVNYTHINQSQLESNFEHVNKEDSLSYDSHGYFCERGCVSVSSPLRMICNLISLFGGSAYFFGQSALLTEQNITPLEMPCVLKKCCQLAKMLCIYPLLDLSLQGSSLISQLLSSIGDFNKGDKWIGYFTDYNATFFDEASVSISFTQCFDWMQTHSATARELIPQADRKALCEALFLFEVDPVAAPTSSAKNLKKTCTSRTFFSTDRKVVLSALMTDRQTCLLLKILFQLKK